MGPRDRELTVDEQTVEIVEILESCDDYSDLDDDDNNEEYYVEELY